MTDHRELQSSSHSIRESRNWDSRDGAGTEQGQGGSAASCACLGCSKPEEWQTHPAEAALGDPGTPKSHSPEIWEAGSTQRRGSVAARTAALRTDRSNPQPALCQGTQLPTTHLEQQEPPLPDLLSHFVIIPSSPAFLTSSSSPPSIQAGEGCRALHRSRSAVPRQGLAELPRLSEAGLCVQPGLLSPALLS